MHAGAEGWPPPVPPHLGCACRGVSCILVGVRGHTCHGGLGGYPATVSDTSKTTLLLLLPPSLPPSHVDPHHMRLHEGRVTGPTSATPPVPALPLPGH